MKRPMLYAIAASLLLLAACGALGSAPTTLYTLEGEWKLEQQVTQSSRAGVEVGDTFTTRVSYTTEGDRVTESRAGGPSATGTRSGNSVTTVWTGQSGGLNFDVTSAFTLLSDDRLAGTVTHRYFDGTRVVMEVSGERVDP